MKNIFAGSIIWLYTNEESTSDLEDMFRETPQTEKQREKMKGKIQEQCNNLKDVKHMREPGEGERKEPKKYLK